MGHSVHDALSTDILPPVPLVLSSLPMIDTLNFLYTLNLELILHHQLLSYKLLESSICYSLDLNIEISLSEWLVTGL